MGIKIAPQAFQRMVADCLQREGDTDFEPYIDDILNGTPAVDGEICQNTLDLHWERVRRLFERLHDCYLTVKPDKCHLFRTRVKYCGHILEGGTRRPAKSKVEAITGWTKEMIKTPKQMKGFLELANWYAIYIKNFAQHAAPLMESLKGKYSEGRPQGQKNHKIKVKPENNTIQWTKEMEAGFEAIKQALVSDDVVNHIPVPGGAYRMHTDASDFAVGAVLEQEISPGVWKVIAYFSRKLQNGQVNWSVREKETYALVTALLKFEPWVGGG